MSEAAVTREPDFLAGFRGLERQLARSGPDWLREARRAYLERFERIGFPSTDDEDWRNTSVSPIASTPFHPPQAGAQRGVALSGLAALDLGGPRLVLVDGRRSAELSSPETQDGLRIAGLAGLLEREPELVREAWTRGDPASAPAFRALNHALAEDGAVVRIADGLALDRPIHVVHVSTAQVAAERPTATHSRTLVLAGRGSRATLVESFVGPGTATYLTNAVTEVELRDEASLEHCRVQLESEQAYHVAHVDSRQGAHSRYSACHVSLGGLLARNEIRAVLAGPGATCTLDGLYATAGAQHLDNHTILDHAAPHCDSRETFKGVLRGRSRTVFHGRIVVRPGAQQTDAKQSNRNLLLSAEALAQTRPQLEIYADDVKCTHGATIGRLDADALFYLRSRGIAADAARMLLVEAFLGEVLERLHVEPLRRFLEAHVAGRLAVP